MLSHVIIKVFIFLGTAEYRRFLNKTEEKASSISKMFIFQLVNTALMIILVNAKNPFGFSLPEGFPILTGKYDDFTVQWYRIVGTTIIITMMANIFVPFLAEILLGFPGVLKRWRDRSFTLDMKKTRKFL